MSLEPCLDIRRVATAVSPCVCFRFVSSCSGFGYGSKFPLACLGVRSPSYSGPGVRSGIPLDGCHVGAPHNGLGSPIPSPYRLVGGEWALTCASLHVEPELDLLSLDCSDRSIKSSPGNDPSHDRSQCGFSDSVCVCHVCGKYELGHCPHAIARLGAIQSLIVLGSDVCEGSCVETSVALGSGSVKQYIVSAPLILKC